MKRLLAALLALGAVGCEEPYYGDVRVAQFRPDDPRVVGPNAYQLRMAPYGAASPRPVYELRSPMGVMQRQWQNWTDPVPPPAAAAPPAAATVAVAAPVVVPAPMPATAPGLPPIAGPAPLALDGPGQPLVVPGSLQPPLPGIPGQPAPPSGTETLSVPLQGGIARDTLPPIAAPFF